MRRIALAAGFALAATGCAAVRESFFSPVTRRLDLANEQLAVGNQQVGQGVALLQSVDAKLTETNERVGRIEAQLDRTDRRLQAVEAKLDRANGHIEHMDAVLTDTAKTIGGMSKTLAYTHKRVEVMDGRLEEANKKLDETNKKLTTVEQAARKIPGVKPE